MDRHELNRLNELLKVELGDDPLYLWDTVRTKRLLWPCRKLKRVIKDGKGVTEPEYNFRCICGTNVPPAEHRKGCTGFVVPEPVFEMRHFFDGHPNRAYAQFFESGGWMCIMRQRFSRAMWAERFGSLPFMDELYVPMNVDSIGPVVLPRGTQPNADLTYHLIGIVKAGRELSLDQYMAEIAADMEKREQEKINQRHDKLNDMTIGPRGSIANAGKVDGPVSLPTVTPKSKNLIEVVKQ